MKRFLSLVGMNLLVTVLLLFLGIPSAFALNIIFNNTTPGVTNPDALTAFEKAANRWEALFVDDVTVRLDIGFESMDPGVIGGSLSEIDVFYYGTVAGALFADANSAWDTIATSNLISIPSTVYPNPVDPNGIALPFWTNESDGTIVADFDGGNNNTFLAVGRGNLRYRRMEVREVQP